MYNVQRHVGTQVHTGKPSESHEQRKLITVTLCAGILWTVVLYTSASSTLTHAEHMVTLLTVVCQLQLLLVHNYCGSVKGGVCAHMHTHAHTDALTKA